MVQSTISFPIKPSAVRYIKLGEGGAWEADCLNTGTVRIGFGSAWPERFAYCQEGRWEDLRATFLAEGRSKGTASRFAKEVRTFFEDDGSTLWITFSGLRLHWAFLSNEPPQLHSDAFSVVRPTFGSWSCRDAIGEELTTDRLPGSLTKLAAFRGTSCNVGMADYVVRRINGERIPQVERGIAAYEQAKSSTLALIQLLDWKDFETLVDLILSSSGWRRVGVVGKTQKTLDLDVILPSTGERALVQVKSASTSRELAEYLAALSDAGPFDRLIYVHHSGTVETDDERALVIGPERVAELALDAGLMKWLIDKAS